VIQEQVLEESIMENRHLVRPEQADMTYWERLVITFVILKIFIFSKEENARSRGVLEGPIHVSRRASDHGDPQSTYASK